MGKSENSFSPKDSKGDAITTRMATFDNLSDKFKEAKDSIEYLKDETHKTFGLVCDSLDVLRDSIEEKENDSRKRYDYIVDRHNTLSTESHKVYLHVEKNTKNINTLEHIVAIQSVIISILVMAVVFVLFSIF